MEVAVFCIQSVLWLVKCIYKVFQNCLVTFPLAKYLSETSASAMRPFL